MLKPSLPLLLLAAAACSAAPNARPRRLGPPRQGFIVGGESVDISQFPWQVSLEFQGDHNCGGSIISATWVLTAAHCAEYAARYYAVRAGSSLRESGGTMYDVTTVIAHGGFDTYSGDYDIGVWSISGSFAFGENVQMVTLATTEPDVGAAMTISGWGDLKYGGSPPRQLQAVSVPIVDRETCSDFWVGVNERMLCAGGDGRSACHGDSGGALVANGTEYGIFSRTGCTLVGEPDVYTNVAALRSWITRYTGV